MRIARIAVGLMAMLCSSCGDRTVQIVTPLAEARSKLNGNFTGDLVLQDGRRLQLYGGRLLGPWVCGSVIAARRDVCVETVKVNSLAEDERRMGLGSRIGQGIALIVMAPAIALWMYSDHESDKKSRLAAAEAAELRRMDEAEAAAKGETLPPSENRMLEMARLDLADCVDPSRGRKLDGAVLAESVWQDRQTCLDDAVRWFTATGELGKARRLTFILRARQRYEALACGQAEPGLPAPQQDVFDASAGDWMAEYRAVVAEPDTYDFPPSDRPCNPYWVEGIKQNPEPISRSAAKAKAIVGFPLTEIP